MPTIKTFPIERGLQGINHLAIFLNGQSLKGQWHFAFGTRFSQPLISIIFDDASDAEPAWQNYHNRDLVGPPTH